MIKISNSNKTKNDSVDETLSFLNDLDFGAWSFVKCVKDESYWQDLKDFFNKNQIDQYQNLVIVGIGGSSLGIRALYSALRGQHNGKKIIFLDDVDTYEFERSYSKITAPKDTMYLLISKSGNTEETLFLTNMLHQKLSERGVNLADNSAALTSEVDSELGSWAVSNDVPIFRIPKEVGGRFSILTAVGMLPALFLGQKLEDMKAAAEWALKQKKLIQQMMSYNLLSFKQEKWIQLYWVYSSQWINFGYWLQQLWCESLGKKEQLNGEPAIRVSSAFVCQGPRDQHSLLQQVSEAHKDKQIWFFHDLSVQKAGERLSQSLFERQKCLENKSLGELAAVECEAAQIALDEAGVSSQTLTFETANMETICASFMLMELYVASFGHLLNINTFNQPGVENTKKQISKILGR